MKKDQRGREWLRLNAQLVSNRVGNSEHDYSAHDAPPAALLLGSWEETSTVTTAVRRPSGISGSGARRRCFRLLSLLLLILALFSCVSSAADLYSEVAPEVRAFYRAWLRRELRPDELQAATREYIGVLTRMGLTPAKMEEDAKGLANDAKLLRERDGAPVAITFRRHLLEAYCFNPALQQQNPIRFRLISETDPPRILDRKHKHLMTQGDVVALANLIVFAGSQGDPHRTDFSRQQIDQLAAGVERSFRTGPGDDYFFMPKYYFEASALWAGILREWRGLTPAEKLQVRNYAAKGKMAPMDDKIYAKLLDLSPVEAYLHKHDDMGSAISVLSARNNIIRQFSNYLNRSEGYPYH